jgi:hypothetical protein
VHHALVRRRSLLKKTAARRCSDAELQPRLLSQHVARGRQVGLARGVEAEAVAPPDFAHVARIAHQVDACLVDAIRAPQKGDAHRLVE